MANITLQDGRQFKLYKSDEGNIKAGSVWAVCKRRAEHGADYTGELLPKDNPQAIRIQQVESLAAEDYLCFRHWQERQEKKNDAKWNEIRGEKQESIIIGQAANLALQTVLHVYKDPEAKGFKEKLDKAFKFFHQFLKEKQNGTPKG